MKTGITGATGQLGQLDLVLPDAVEGIQPVRNLQHVFPAREGGSKKGSFLLSWTDGGLCSGRPSYLHASRSFYKALLPVEASRFGSLPAKPPIGEGPKDGAYKVDRAPVV